MEQELLILPGHMTSLQLLMGSCYSILCFLCSILWVIVCSFFNHICVVMDIVLASNAVGSSWVRDPMCVMLCRSLFDLFFFFFFFAIVLSFDLSLWYLIPIVSSNSSFRTEETNDFSLQHLY